MDHNFFYRSQESPSPEWIFPPAFAGEGKEGEQPEPGIDLNEQLIRNRQSTFFLRVNSDVMTAAGIHKGDVIIVDRSVEARNGKIIIAELNGEMLIRRLEITEHRKRLVPAGRKLAPIEINEGSSFAVWGVVTYVIHGF